MPPVGGLCLTKVRSSASQREASASRVALFNVVALAMEVFCLTKVRFSLRCCLTQWPQQLRSFASQGWHLHCGSVWRYAPDGGGLLPHESEIFVHETCWGRGYLVSPPLRSNSIDHCTIYSCNTYKSVYKDMLNRKKYRYYLIIVCCFGGLEPSWCLCIVSHWALLLRLFLIAFVILDTSLTSLVIFGNQYAYKWQFS